MTQMGFPDYRTNSLARKEITAGHFPQPSEPAVLKQGQNLPEGAIIGVITSGADKGKIVLSVKAAADGSQVPVGILAFDVDATDVDSDCEYFVGGQYQQDALTYGTGHDVASVKAAFAGTPLFLKSTRGGQPV